MSLVVFGWKLKLTKSLRWPPENCLFQIRQVASCQTFTSTPFIFSYLNCIFAFLVEILISVCSLGLNFLRRMSRYSQTTISASSSTKLYVIIFLLRCQALISAYLSKFSSEIHVIFWSKFLATCQALPWKVPRQVSRYENLHSVRSILPNYNSRQYLIKGFDLVFLIEISSSYLGKCLGKVLEFYFLIVMPSSYLNNNLT